MSRQRPRRADLVRQFLAKQPGGRAKVSDIAEFIAEQEDRDDLLSAAISVAVRNENERLSDVGEPAVFRVYPEGEEWGWVALTNQDEEAFDGDHGLAGAIRERNNEVRAELRKRLSDLDWRTFESTFLTNVLEALGFQEVQVTQATRDGGVDARVTYRRGLVHAQAIVSAKHWRKSVPVDEVRNVRGIKGPEDTAIIITSGSFTAGAAKEAEPGQNQRAVYLIDGERIVETCVEKNIGIRKVKLPDLYALDEQSLGSVFSPTTRTARARESTDSEEPKRRLRREMLGDGDRGLSAEEIADLLELSVGTVRTYLSNPERRQSLFERLRADVRDKALAIVAKKRV